MPLSRTRSLLSNINGVANGGSNGVSNGSTANTPSDIVNGYNLPSINGSSDHLPPLKAGSNKNNNLFGTPTSSVNGVVTSNGVANGHHNVVSNGSAVNGHSGPTTNGSSYMNSNGVGSVVSNGGTNGIGVHDLETMSTTGSISLTNGHATGTATTHMNGMQTLPHVRASAANAAVVTTAVLNGEDGGNGGQASDSPKHVQQQQQGVVVATSQSGGQAGQVQALPSQSQSQQVVQQVQQSPTNSASAVSTNAVNANTTGSLKPKTMVATPEQVRSSS